MDPDPAFFRECGSGCNFENECGSMRIRIQAYGTLKKQEIFQKK
jgi:hypothetical protein